MSGKADAPDVSIRKVASHISKTVYHIVLKTKISKSCQDKILKLFSSCQVSHLGAQFHVN